MYDTVEKLRVRAKIIKFLFSEFRSSNLLKIRTKYDTMIKNYLGG